MTLDQCRRTCYVHGAEFVKRLDSNAYDIMGLVLDPDGTVVSVRWNYAPIVFNLHGHVWSETILSALRAGDY